jgi:hypothetical protein
VIFNDLSLQLIKLFQIVFVRFRIYIRPLYFLRRPSVGFYLSCLGINFKAMVSIRFNKVRPGSPSRIELLARYIKLDLTDPTFVETRLCSFHALNRNQLAHPSTNKGVQVWAFPLELANRIARSQRAFPFEGPRLRLLASSDLPRYTVSAEEFHIRWVAKLTGILMQ